MLVAMGSKCSFGRAALKQDHQISGRPSSSPAVCVTLGWSGHQTPAQVRKGLIKGLKAGQAEVREATSRKR